MTSEFPISIWLNGLWEGEADAIQVLWSKFFEQLVALSERHIRAATAGIVDGEDVAASVFHSIWNGAKAGRFQDVKNLDEVWWLLVAMAKRKCIDHARRESAAKRGGAGQKVSLDQNPEILYNSLVSQQPDPQYVAAFGEEYARLLGLLDDVKQREIAVLRVEGHTVPEIAEKLKIAPVTVHRKLKIIRQIWSQELSHDSEH